MSNHLYTKNGRPLQMHGDKIYSASGAYIGHVRGRKVFNPSGAYAGTIVGDRVVYRAVDSASISGPSISISRVGTARVPRVPSAMLGDEPPFPD